jgi:hypothetical protein
MGTHTGLLIKQLQTPTIVCICFVLSPIIHSRQKKKKKKSVLMVNLKLCGKVENLPTFFLAIVKTECFGFLNWPKFLISNFDLTKTHANNPSEFFLVSVFFILEFNNNYSYDGLLARRE